MIAATLHTLRRFIAPVNAQVFNADEGGLRSGLDLIAGNLGGLFQGTLQEIIVRIIILVLDLVGIVAVGMIVIAGVYLITGQGEEDSKTKAKNIIIWTIAGLVVILLSRVILGFVLGFLASITN